MPRKVFLHIGAPKTGTTYVQDRLVANQDGLRAHGVTLPTKSKLVLPDVFWFRAALDLMDQDWGGAPGHSSGAWDTLVRRTARASDHVVISHEILAPAKPDKIARVVADLGKHELHVIYSARDLARQVPAAWQESIKQGRRWSLAKFSRRFIDKETFFARAMDMPAVLQAWGEHLPAERIHVITVPQRGGGTRGVLWQRMCQALALDPDWLPNESTRVNPSLGAAETAIVRDLNRAMGRRTRKDAIYDELILQAISHGALAKRRSLPVTLAPQHREWAEATAAEWIDFLAATPFEVIGASGDLAPVFDAEQEWRNPDKVSAKRRLRPAMAALAAMTHEAAARPDPKRQLGNMVKLGTERLLRR